MKHTTRYQFWPLEDVSSEGFSGINVASIVL